jgi:hypothetical protein
MSNEQPTEAAADSESNSIDPQAQAEENAEFLANRVKEKWKTQPRIQLIAIFQAGDEQLLAETIETLGMQLYSSWDLTVVSALAVANDQFNNIPGLKWVTVVEDSIQAAVVEEIRKTSDDWIGFIRPGDQLEAQTLFLLVDYINSKLSWKLIYTDEDHFNGKGEIVETVNKPEFDGSLLEKENFIQRGVFIKRELYQEIDGLSADLDAIQSICAKVVAHTGDFVIGHIPVVLYHAAEAS